MDRANRLKQNFMLSVEKLSYSYDGGEKMSFPDFVVKEGETLLVLGDSGVGKTTLLHLLGGIISSQKGKIVLEGTEVNSLRGKSLDIFRANNIGIIFQEAHFMRSLNVAENLSFIQNLAGIKPDQDFISDLLEKVRLYERKSYKTQKLSQGEKQRLNILRAVITKPKLILADEPTSALDDTNCYRVLDLLLALVSEVNAALVIVTHDNRLKDRFSNQIALA